MSRCFPLKTSCRTRSYLPGRWRGAGGRGRRDSDRGRPEGAGRERQPPLLLDALADALQPREHRRGRDFVGHADDDSIPRRDGAEELVQIGLEVGLAGAGHDHRGWNPAEEREMAAPLPVILGERDLGHRRRAERLGDVHPRVADQLHQPAVLAVGVAEHELAGRAED
jgi:hypothetical protein